MLVIQYSLLQFALYLMDVNYDNFAVSPNGDVTVVDAENILVVDRWQLERGKYW